MSHEKLEDCDKAHKVLLRRVEAQRQLIDYTADEVAAIKAHWAAISKIFAFAGPVLVSLSAFFIWAAIENSNSIDVLIAESEGRKEAGRKFEKQVWESFSEMKTSLKSMESDMRDIAKHLIKSGGLK